jgi:hypothetical protein
MPHPLKATFARALVWSSAMLLLSFAGRPGMASTLIEPPAKDASLVNHPDHGPDFHNPATDWAIFGSYVYTQNFYPLIQFDLSALPANLSPGTEVTLQLTEQGVFHSHNQFRAHVYALTQDWDPATVTWNQASPGQSWRTPGGAIDFGHDWASTPFRSTGGEYEQYVEFGVTDLVNAWRHGSLANHGLAVIPQLLEADNSSPGAAGGASDTNYYTLLGLSGASDPQWRPALIFGDLRNPDLVLRPMPVPELSSLWMMLAGLSALVLLTRHHMPGTSRRALT